MTPVTPATAADTTADTGDTTPVPDPPGVVAWRSVGFTGPTAVYYDDVSRSVFVANAGTGGDGFLSRLAPDGTVVAARWVGGLAGPVGMRSFKNSLYVACGDHLAVIDVGKAEVAGRVPVPGAALGALAVDGAGVVYATDRAAGRVYA